jgi:hypothetical protein
LHGWIVTLGPELEIHRFGKGFLVLDGEFGGLEGGGPFFRAKATAVAGVA